MPSPTTISLWNDTADPAPDRPFGAIDPAGDALDVVVVGAGIVGLTTALLLAREGRRVLVLEARQVGTGVTGSTTGKVTAAHGLRYDGLRRKIGPERTQQYAAANQAAVAWVRELIATERIACDWQDRIAYTYTSDRAMVPKLRRETVATVAAGLPAHDAQGVAAPTELLAGVAIEGGGELHGRNYCIGLARLAEAAGAGIAEGVRVVGAREGDPCRVRTADHGEIRAEHVVVATHYPVFDRGLHFARLVPQRSYAIAARLTGDLPTGSFYDVGPPSRSVRTATGPDGEPVVVVAGEGHQTGRSHPTSERYARLERWSREHLSVGAVTHRWSAQDPQALDDVPYVGPLRPGSRALWTATAFDKWGLSGGTAAAHAIADRIAGREDPYAALWNPSRRRQLIPSGLLRFAKLNAETAGSLVGDRLRPDRLGGSAEDLEPGEGRVVGRPGRQAAVFRDRDGTVYAHSAVCTHLGCEVRFNDAEQSWDCPCHGSRFDARDGSVLEGPAVRPLKPVAPSDAANRGSAAEGW